MRRKANAELKYNLIQRNDYSHQFLYLMIYTIKTHDPSQFKEPPEAFLKIHINTSNVTI